MSRPSSTTIAADTEWRSVADQLAGALKEAMLRNPGLTAVGWARAHAALGRYEHAGEPTGTEPAPVVDIPDA